MLTTFLRHCQAPRVTKDMNVPPEERARLKKEERRVIYAKANAKRRGHGTDAALAKAAKFRHMKATLVDASKGLRSSAPR